MVGVYLLRLDKLRFILVSLSAANRELLIPDHASDPLKRGQDSA